MLQFKKAISMLSIIGLGLDVGDISYKGLKAIRDADTVLMENYTLPLPQGYIDFLERETGKKIIAIDRRGLEDNVALTIEPAIGSDMAILVPGDPLIATTHHIIAEAARKAGTETHIIHSSSIFTAGIGESGLDIYRFGPTTTVPFWSSKYKPVSFIDVIKKNLENNQHTLVLLDVDAHAGLTMSYSDAITLIKKAEEKRGTVVIGNRKIIILCEIGTENQNIIYTETDNTKLQRLEKRLVSKRTALIIPSDMNFAEKDLVMKFEL